jgi:DNA-binding HxlR family transcriptional regulator
LAEPGKAARKRRRAGSTILIQLTRPAGCPTIRALAARPMRLTELAEELGGPSKPTVRARLDDLIALGAVAKKGGGMPFAVWSELTGVGHDLARVVDAVEAWLSRASRGPIPLGSPEAKNAVRTLVGGWEATMLDAFAAAPQSLSQLDREVDWLSYPALERRLAALRSVGLVEPVPGGVGTLARISRWGREGGALLLSATCFERAHMAESTVPLNLADEETLSLLASGS